MLIFFLLLNKNICCGALWKRLIKTLPLSTHNICFLAEIRKLEIRTPPSSRSLAKKINDQMKIEVTSSIKFAYILTKIHLFNS